jgi:hypothetical protein
VYDSGEGIIQSLLTSILESARKADISEFILPIPRNTVLHPPDESFIAIKMLEAFQLSHIYTVHIGLSPTEKTAY